MKTSLPSRALWVDHLRSFITVLVIAHHAALAYTSFASFDPAAYILSTHPVVDPHRWPLLDRFVGFNDTFFMPLMFLISGMFTLPALRRKGVSSFLGDRFRRLFIPFFLAVTLLMWIAYYPAWLLAGKSPGIHDYLVDFFTVEAWPVGPPWFIWVLFLFNVVIAMMYKPLEAIFTRTADLISRLARKPIIFFILFFILSLLLYVPADNWFGTYTWTGLGPFDFQKSRMLLYFGYFVIGAIIGLTNFNEGLFERNGVMVKSWPLWAGGSIGAYALQIAYPGPYLFTLTMVLANLAFLTVFSAFSTGDNRIWRSLSKKAYGMYLVHYIFIVWSQYALMGLDWPAGIKFLITFILSTMGSWVVVKKIPAWAGI